MDATTLLIAALCLLAGLAIGGLLTRTLSPQLKKQRELEEQLRRTEDEYRIYQQDVSEHFVKSTDLLRTISQNYRALGDQLTSGALRLTTTEVSRDLMEAANPLLSGQSSVLSATPTEPPKDYAPSVPGGVLSENYGLDDQPRPPSFSVYRHDKPGDGDTSVSDADHDDPTYKVG